MCVSIYSANLGRSEGTQCFSTNLKSHTNIGSLGTKCV